MTVGPEEQKFSKRSVYISPGARLTRWPDHLLRREARSLVVGLEPNGSGSIPGVDILSIRNLGHVELKRARVIWCRVRQHTYATSSSNGHGLSSGGQLVTTDIRTGNITDEAIALPVGWLPQSPKVGCLLLPVDNQARVVVCQSC
jgi:hypothetical protein